MTEEMLQNQADEISKLLATQLRVKGRTLEDQLRKAGRRLPKKLRADVERLIEANRLIQNPKLARMVDRAAISTGNDRVIAHLRTLEPWERFKDRWLGILGAISAALIFTFVVVVYILWQRGLV